MPNVLFSDLDQSGSLASGDIFPVLHAAGPPADYFTATQLGDYVTRTYTATAITVASGGTISSAGNYTLGAGTALATTATVGYVMVPSCAGIPTGIPVGFAAGNIPLVVDTTNFRVYCYMPSGAWRFATLT